MILSNNLSQKTHYEIIGVKEDASHEEIRKTYRSAILNYHPDKQQKTSETSSLKHEKFLELQKARDILADRTSRALYDNELRTLRQDAVTAEDLSLGDMTIEDTGSYFELFYHCRCGDYFSVDSAELAEMGYPLLRNDGQISLETPRSLPASVVLPCGSCSLKVRLFIDANTIRHNESSS